MIFIKLCKNEVFKLKFFYLFNVVAFFLFSCLFAKDNVLVTGGSGYIGSHACKSLKQAGFNPIVVDTQDPPAVINSWGQFVKGDIRDKNLMVSILDKYKPTAVMHFAAKINVDESVKNPFYYYDNNTFGTMSLLEAMAETHIDKIIFSSSSAVYGDVLSGTAITEDCDVGPISPYGSSKLFCETIIKDYSKAYGINFVIFRYFNAAGSDPDLELGSKLSGESIISNCIKTALGERGNFTVFGTMYPTRDGTCIRDYVHVTDIADAHVLALKHMLNGGKSDIFNLGSELGFSVKEVLMQFAKTTKVDLPVIFAGPRPGDSISVVSNAEKAKTVLKWAPKYSELNTIIDTAWKYVSKDQPSE